MSRILILNRTAQPVGGGEAVLAWTLQALQDRHRLTVLTWTPADLSGLNRVFGTSLHVAALRCWSAPAALRRVFAFDPDPYSIYPVMVLWWIARLVGSRFDAVLHMADEGDLWQPAIQYVHYPSLGQGLAALNTFPHIWSRMRALLRGEVRPWVVLSGTSSDGIRTNLTFANSQWTADVFTAAYGVRPLVMYPPVVALPPGLPWDARQARFLCYGRFSSEKRYEAIIDVIERVRGMGHDVGLTIVGLPWSADYRRAVLERAHAAASWVEVHENLDRAALVELIGRHRYGIHANMAEHFGIAVAEMIRGGCVVFVPDDGGQVEIVGGDQRLLWRTPEEAAARIDAVLRDPELQQTLRADLSLQAQRFDSLRFMQEMRDAVEDLVTTRRAERQHG